MLVALFAWLWGCTATDSASAWIERGDIEVEGIEGDPHGRRFRFATPPDSLRCTSDDGDVLEKDGAVEVELHGFLASTRYSCLTDDAQASFTTDPLPENLPLPGVEVSGDPAEIGYHLTNVFRNTTSGDGINATDAFLVVFDAAGRPRWQREGAYGADTDVSWVEGTVLVAYHVLPERTLAWTVRREGIAMQAVAIRSRDLEGEIRAWREAITRFAANDDEAKPARRPRAAAEKVRAPRAAPRAKTPAKRAKK